MRATSSGSYVDCNPMDDHVENPILGLYTEIVATQKEYNFFQPQLAKCFRLKSGVKTLHH